MCIVDLRALVHCVCVGEYGLHVDALMYCVHLRVCPVVPDDHVCCDCTMGLGFFQHQDNLLAVAAAAVFALLLRLYVRRNRSNESLAG